MKRFLAWCHAVPEALVTQPRRSHQDPATHGGCRLCHVQALTASADARCLRHRLGLRLP